MRPTTRPVLLAAAAALLLPVATGAQSTSAPAFSGRYRLVLTASPSCPAPVRVGPLSVEMNLTQAPVSAGAEVSGIPPTPPENPDRGRLVLLRQGDKLHGPIGGSTLEIGLPALEGTYRVWVQIMADGTATTATGGRAGASGTAFGRFVLALANDPDGDPIADCEFALDHRWSLEPS
jgi:hypothetical protein